MLIRFSTEDKTRKLNRSGFSMMKMLKFSKERKAYGHWPQNRQFMIKNVLTMPSSKRSWKWERPTLPKSSTSQRIIWWRPSTNDENYGRKLWSDFFWRTLAVIMRIILWRNQELPALHLGVSTVRMIKYVFNTFFLNFLKYSRKSE